MQQVAIPNDSVLSRIILAEKAFLAMEIGKQGTERLCYHQGYDRHDQYSRHPGPGQHVDSSSYTQVPGARFGAKKLPAYTLN